MGAKQPRAAPARREVAQFSISFLQLLDGEGSLLAGDAPDLSRDDLARLYRWMVLAREGDQRMLRLQRQGRIGTFGLGTGEEATVCGATFAMTPRDWFVGSYRELAGMFMRGHKLSSALLFYNGFEEGNLSPAAPRTLPISIIVGAQTLHAVGIAYAMRYLGEKDVAAVTFLGDGGTSQGDFHEAMNFAAVWDAPVVFICRNNQYAISLPRQAQTHSATIAQKAIAYGMPGIQVDGNDVLAVYEATREALERARAGEGPTFIEAITYRLMQHTTADDPTRYREEKEVEEWWKRDPLPRFRKFLEKSGFWNEALEEKLQAEVRQEVEAAVAEFESLRDFAPDAPFDFVYGTKHPLIEEQRADFLANLRKEAADGQA